MRTPFTSSVLTLSLSSSVTSCPSSKRTSCALCGTPLIRFSNSVTENGFSVKDESMKPMPHVLHDEERVHYFRGTTSSLRAAMFEDGVDVKAYFPWSELRELEIFVLPSNSLERSPRQLRVGRRVHHPFRSHLRRLRHPEAIPQRLCQVPHSGKLP